MTPDRRGPDRPQVPRHPSAGNLGGGPSLVKEQPAEDTYPPASFPFGDATGPPTLLGPGLDPELSTRLLGNVDGKRVLELGAGTGRLAITLARQGARVITVDSSNSRLSEARGAAEAAGTKVEFHHGDLADLAFIRADQIDLAIAIYSLAAVDDLARALRQVNRVLRSESTLLFSIPHPLSLMVAIQPNDPAPRLTRTAFDRTPVTWTADEESGVVHPHQVGDVVTMLWRSNFRVDTVLEVGPDRGGATGPHSSPVGEWVPTTAIFRARKQGI